MPGRRQAGPVRPEPRWWIRRSASDSEAELWLLANQDVTVVLVANHQIAIGVLRRPRVRPQGAQGLDIVGFDDIPEAAFLFPPFNTVEQDFTEVGHAVEVMRSQIEGGHPAMRPLQPPRSSSD